MTVWGTHYFPLPGEWGLRKWAQYKRRLSECEGGKRWTAWATSKRDYWSYVLKKQGAEGPLQALQTQSSRFLSRWAEKDQPHTSERLQMSWVWSPLTGAWVLCLGRLWCYSNCYSWGPQVTPLGALETAVAGSSRTSGSRHVPPAVLGNQLLFVLPWSTLWAS